mmetsp:Transcript_39766/g.101677  ORF Transcript_39766/g.101677 Transcript_39766/m.101677 type:complete len:261 (+) Transcript_39766:39-821(+)
MNHPWTCHCQNSNRWNPIFWTPKSLEPSSGSAARALAKGIPSRGSSPERHRPRLPRGCAAPSVVQQRVGRGEAGAAVQERVVMRGRLRLVEQLPHVAVDCTVPPRLLSAHGLLHALADLLLLFRFGLRLLVRCCRLPLGVWLMPACGRLGACVVGCPNAALPFVVPRVQRLCDALLPRAQPASLLPARLLQQLEADAILGDGVLDGPMPAAAAAARTIGGTGRSGLARVPVSHHPPLPRPTKLAVWCGVGGLNLLRTIWS